MNNDEIIDKKLNQVLISRISRSDLSDMLNEARADEFEKALNAYAMRVEAKKKIYKEARSDTVKQIFSELDKIIPNYEQSGTTYTYEQRRYRTIQQVISDIKKKYKVD